MSKTSWLDRCSVQLIFINLLQIHISNDCSHWMSTFLNVHVSAAYSTVLQIGVFQVKSDSVCCSLTKRGYCEPLSTVLLSLLFRGRSRKVHEASDSTDAQKKFGDAKSISSDQYFGGKDPDVSIISVVKILLNLVAETTVSKNYSQGNVSRIK